MDKNTDKLTALFAEVFSEDPLMKVIFSGKRRKSLEYSKVTLRPMQIGGRLKYQAEYTYPKKVTHSNLDTAAARSLALRLICEEFKQANIFTRDSEIQVLAAKPETPRITRKALTMPTAAASAAVAAAPAPALAHNRAKNYVLPAGVPCDFLIRLGIMGEDGTVFPRSYNKFRQINRYLEIVEDVFPYLPKDKTLKIIVSAAARHI